MEEGIEVSVRGYAYYNPFLMLRDRRKDESRLTIFFSVQNSVLLGSYLFWD